MTKRGLVPTLRVGTHARPLRGPKPAAAQSGPNAVRPAGRPRESGGRRFAPSALRDSSEPRKRRQTVAHGASHGKGAGKALGSPVRGERGLAHRGPDDVQRPCTLPPLPGLMRFGRAFDPRLAPWATLFRSSGATNGNGAKGHPMTRVGRTERSEARRKTERVRRASLCSVRPTRLRDSINRRRCREESDATSMVSSLAAGKSSTWERLVTAGPLGARRWWDA